MPSPVALIDSVLGLCIVFVAIHVVISWLIGYRLISTDNPRVAAIRTFFIKATNPVLWPIRLVSVDTGDVDMSPVILIVLLLAVRYVLKFYPMM